MSSVVNPDSKDKVPSHSVKEDIKMKFNRDVEALGNHLTEASGAAVSRPLQLFLVILFKEDLINTHSPIV